MEVDDAMIEYIFGEVLVVVTTLVWASLHYTDKIHQRMTQAKADGVRWQIDPIGKSPDNSEIIRVPVGSFCTFTDGKWDPIGKSPNSSEIIRAPFGPRPQSKATEPPATAAVLKAEVLMHERSYIEGRISNQYLYDAERNRLHDRLKEIGVELCQIVDEALTPASIPDPPRVDPRIEILMHERILLEGRALKDLKLMSSERSSMYQRIREITTELCRIANANNCSAGQHVYANDSCIYCKAIKLKEHDGDITGSLPGVKIDKFRFGTGGDF